MIQMVNFFIVHLLVKLFDISLSSILDGNMDKSFIGRS